MNDLFGGLDGQDINSKKEVNKKNNKQNDNNLFNNLNTNINDNNKNTDSNNKNNNFNLFEGLTQNNNTNNKNINNNINQSNQVNNLNQNNNINNNNQGNIDLLGDIFGSNYTSNSNSNNLNLFSNLSPPQQANSTNNYFTPLNINTDQFGEMWENSPEEDSFEININIQSPQKFHEIIKSKGNFAAVDIINNEAISAANYKNQFALVHATIEMNQVNLLVKCQNKSYNNEVGYFVMALFK